MKNEDPDYCKPDSPQELPISLSINFPKTRRPITSLIALGSAWPAAYVWKRIFLKGVTRC